MTNEPFEIRCKKAEEALLLWTLLVKIPVEDDSRREERVQYKNKFFTLFSDPLQLNIEPLFTDVTKRERVLKLVSAMYGEDAVATASR